MAQPTYQDLLKKIQKLEKENEALVENEKTLKAALDDLQNAHNSFEANLTDSSFEKQTPHVSFHNGTYHKDMTESERKNFETRFQHMQKMEAIGTLAGGVAHDLNNVLSGLMSYPELILMDLKPDSPIYKPILTIQKSGEKAAAMVQDLLTLARRGVIVTEVVNLNHIILEYLSSPEFEKLQYYHPNVQIKTDLKKNLSAISGSPIHLSKSIMNLISNAAEAMTDNGIIHISTETCYINGPIPGSSDIKDGNYVVLSVSDSGIGISDEDIKKIFEPFYTKKVMGRSGTGLGMAVVWGTVKDHNGYIDVTSASGQGTTFTLYFPVTSQLEVKKKETFFLEQLKGNGEKILIIDDIEEQRDIASSILKKLGYWVDTVESGEDAIEYVKKHKIDLLLLDMIMKGLDGLDTYRKIISLFPGQKAIVVSGFSETRRVKELQELGAGSYIKKPYSIEKISKAIFNELHKKKA